MDNDKRRYQAILESKNLRYFRPETDDDTLLYKQIYSDQDTMKYMCPPFTDEQLRARMTNIEKHWQEFNFGNMAVQHKESQELIGNCGIFHKPRFPSENGVEVGVMMLPQFRGYGHASEIIQAITDYSFEVLKIPFVYASTHKLNIPSQKIFQKLRFDLIEELLYELEEYPFMGRQMIWRKTNPSAPQNE